MAWLTGWKYRKAITLSRASGAVTNYQMQLLVGESSGATGENVDCGGLCLSTFNDIRFTTSDGTTLLDYWIESITGTTPNQLATVWVEFDSIGTGATTFYMYYGNASASAISSGDNTFISFDDFERGSSGDAVGGAWTVTQATVQITTAKDYGDDGNIGTRGCYLYKSATPAPEATIPLTAGSQEYAINVHVWKPDAYTMVPIAHGNGTKRALVQLANDETINYYNGAWTASGANWIKDSWHRLTVQNLDFSAGTFDIAVDGTVVKSGAAMHTNSGNTNVNRIQGEAVSSGAYGYIDNYFVRNWRSTEPAWGSWGAEDTYLTEASFAETGTFTDAVDGYGPWIDGTSETTTITDEMTADLLKESTAETATFTDELVGQSMTDGITETTTITDLMDRIFEIERSTAETITITDLMECVLLVDGISETLTFLDYGTGAPQNPHRRKQMLWDIQNKHIQLKFDHNQAGRGVHLVDCAIRCGRIRREDSVRFVHLGQHIQLKFQHNVASETISIGTVSMQVNRINNPSAAPRDIQSVRFVHQGSHMQLKFQHIEAGKTILLKSLAMACNRINNPL